MSAAIADPVKAATAVIAIKNFFIFNSSVCLFGLGRVTGWRAPIPGTHYEQYSWFRSKCCCRTSTLAGKRALGFAGKSRNSLKIRPNRPADGQNGHPGAESPEGA